MNRMYPLIIGMLVLFTCTGCWDYRELDELAIIGAVGLDKNEEGEGYHVSLQIVNPKEVTAKATGYDTPVTVYEATEETIHKSFRKITEQMPRQAYSAHLRMVVIGEELAKDGIADVLDFLSRDHEMRSDFYFAVAKGLSANEAIGVLTSLENVPANKIFHSLEVSERIWGSTIKTNINDLMSTLTTKGRNSVISGITITGPAEEGQTTKNLETTIEKAILKYDGKAAFKRDRLVGWLNEEESISHNFIDSKLKSTIIDVPCAEGLLGIEVLHTKTKIKGNMEKNKPTIKLDVKVEGNISDVECKVDLTKVDEINKIEKEAEKVLKNNFEKVIQKAQKELKTDIFGFGEAVHRAAPKTWKEIKDNWDTEFEDLPVDIHVHVRIPRIGTIKNPIQQDMKE
ncbi:Ger(x)C family spore germination protein [bacterium LRH843]|nr:Ger(x)C family spore germination protein [bacterium LRH843]